MFGLLITAEMVEVQKIKPHYDVIKDRSGKKINEVHDRIQDKRFN